MRTGPKGQRRPADAISNAVKVMRIATEEEPEDFGQAMAVGVSDRLWSMEDVAALVESAAPVSRKRGPYKKREAV